MKYAIVTFGCRVNQADSLQLEQQLLAQGASVAQPEQADVVLVNTCSVTSSADQGARQTIRRIARVNPSAQVLVTGCYATRAPDEVRQLPNVWRVVPNDEKPRLIDCLDEIGLTSAERFGSGDGGCGAVLEPGVAGRTAFTLRVQTGCAEACSYCIIPSTRGRPRSVPIDDVLRQVRVATKAGFKELAITGVHLGSYGRDLAPERSLAELLAELAGSFPELLFRISSLEPMDCTPEVVELVATRNCFAPHLHLPLQHASARMLAAMCRPYAVEQFAELVDGIRARLPGASIGSDVIVGFPGETDADFSELTSYLSSSPLTHLHVFPYSDRPGTRASALSGKVAGVAVRDRAQQVRLISANLTKRFRDDQVGTLQRALTIDDGSVVVTGNYLKLRIPPGHDRNTWVTVRVLSHHDGELLGR
jgi:threonylcarbamoyladenosine tRNA methylthiotransferase MtaB